MSQTSIKPDHESPPVPPLWVKVFGIIALVVILLFFILMFTDTGGPHGPNLHMTTPISTMEVQQP